MQEKILLNPKEVSKITGISLSKLNKMRMARTGISFIKDGKMIKYHVDDISAYLQRNRVEVKVSNDAVY